MGAEFDRIRLRTCAGGPGHRAPREAVTLLVVLVASASVDRICCCDDSPSGPSRFRFCDVGCSRTLDERLRLRLPLVGPLLHDDDDDEEEEPDAAEQFSTSPMSFLLRWRFGTKRLDGRK
jgi:hypothetical protein